MCPLAANPAHLARIGDTSNGRAALARRGALSVFDDDSAG
jgi:hypothetical protein